MFLGDDWGVDWFDDFNKRAAYVDAAGMVCWIVSLSIEIVWTMVDP